MAEDSEEMQIFSLTYDLLRWLLPHTERFPKEQRLFFSFASVGRRPEDGVQHCWNRTGAGGQPAVRRSGE